MKFLTAILAALAFTGCASFDLSGNRPVACEVARDEVLSLARAQETYDTSESRSDDPVKALAQVWALVEANGYQIYQKPKSWGPLARYTQTLPVNVILLGGGWPGMSDIAKIALAEHELLHMFLELVMDKEEFIRQYIGDAKFRAAIELAAYKVSLQVARKYGRSAKWEAGRRVWVVGNLHKDYLISLALTEQCLTSLAEELWGPISPDAP